MTVQGFISERDVDTVQATGETDQVIVLLRWQSRGKWYTVSEIVITQNEGYPTPMITVTAPPPGIGMRVYDKEGNLLWSDRKAKEQTK